MTTTNTDYKAIYSEQYQQFTGIHPDVQPKTKKETITDWKNKFMRLGAYTTQDKYRLEVTVTMLLIELNALNRNKFWEKATDILTKYTQWVEVETKLKLAELGYNHKEIEFVLTTMPLNHLYHQLCIKKYPAASYVPF
jgi:uncharacterized Rmd1/YagE family protein